MINKTSSTLAASITVDKVLERTRYIHSKELQAYQAKLTLTANELARFAGPLGLGQFLNHEEVELIENAASLVRTVSQRVKHAREKKLREEKVREKVLKERCLIGWKLIDREFALPFDSAEEQLDVIKLALVLNHALVLAAYMDAVSFSAQVREHALSHGAPEFWIGRLREDSVAVR